MKLRNGKKKIKQIFTISKNTFKNLFKIQISFSAIWNFKILKYFNIYTAKINIDEAEMDQSNLLENMVK